MMQVNVYEIIGQMVVQATVANQKIEALNTRIAELEKERNHDAEKKPAQGIR